MQRNNKTDFQGDRDQDLKHQEAQLFLYSCLQTVKYTHANRLLKCPLGIQVRSILVITVPILIIKEYSYKRVWICGDESLIVSIENICVKMDRNYQKMKEPSTDVMS